MCGIAGLVGPAAGGRVEAVRAMAHALRHRGPDGEGLYAAPSGTCVLGHRRLAILDLTDAAAQPMVSADGRWALSYNGELYNYRELRAELERAGLTAHSSGDTETLLHAWQAWGVEALPRLNGMFAFALWDAREQVLWLARDRFGQKPLYLAWDGPRLAFASEMRALEASGLLRPTLDPAAVMGFLRMGAVQEPGAILREVELLPPASVLRFDARAGTVERRTFWSPSTQRSALSAEALCGRFDAAVAAHLVSDAPIGLFLSGGIDSASIAAAAGNARADAACALCVTYPEQPEQDEAAYARAAAAQAGLRLIEAPMHGAGLLACAREALAAMDQPTCDGINTYVVARAAREAGLKAALSGVGGDEWFGGYPSFRDLPAMRALNARLGCARGLAARVLRLAADGRRFEKLADLAASDGSWLDLFRIRRQVFSPAQMGRLCPAWADGAMPGESWADALEALDPLDAVSLLETRVYMGRQLLRDADVMGMAHGLEIRAPFLDALFAEAAWALGPAARRPGRTPKAYWTAAMGGRLPRCVVERPKQGFAMPFATWMQHELRATVEEGLHALTEAIPAFDAEAVGRLWRRFLAHPGSIGWTRPWTLFVLGHVVARRGWHS